MQLALVTAMRSVTGPHRSDNQDSVACSTDYVFVADGVGGHVGGDVASWTVTHRLIAGLAPLAARRLGESDLRTMVALANAELRLRGDRDPAVAGMSTTLTGIFCADDAVRIVHIGDSRAYLVRDGEGRRMTRDDSLVQMLLDSGTIDEAAAPYHPHRNIILHSLGGDGEDAAALTVTSVPAQVGDRWLLCSDGLTDYVDEGELLAELAAAGTAEEAADALLRLAEDADSHDNVTVAVADVVAGEPADERDEAAAQDADTRAGDERPHRFLGAAADPAKGPVLDLTGRPA